MAIPPIHSPLHSPLQQMQTLAAQAAGRNDAVVREPAGGESVQGGFVEELKSSIDKISQLQAVASEQTKAFEMGDPNVSLNDVMVEKQKAGLAFEMGVQVRNRLIQSYKEIMNMQV